MFVYKSKQARFL